MRRALRGRTLRGLTLRDRGWRSPVRRGLAGAALGAAVLSMAACQGTEVSPPGTGGHTSGGAGGGCTSSAEPISGTFGLWKEGGEGGAGGAGGEGSEKDPGVWLSPLETGADVTLQWGSQLGMGLGVVLELHHAGPDDFERVEVALILDGEPLGVQVHEPPAMACEGEALYLESMVMVDVGPHPGVTSVAQLEGREVDLTFSAFESDSEESVVEVASGVLPVVLHL